MTRDDLKDGGKALVIIGGLMLLAFAFWPWLWPLELFAFVIIFMGGWLGARLRRQADNRDRLVRAQLAALERRAP